MDSETSELRKRYRDLAEAKEALEMEVVGALERAGIVVEPTPGAMAEAIATLVEERDQAKMVAWLHGYDPR